MELQQDGPVLLKAEFSSSAGRPSGPTAFAFIIAFIDVAISSSMGSIPRVLAAGCCGSLFGMSESSMSDLALSSKRSNRTHLSRIRPLSRSDLPSSLRPQCGSTFFASSSCTDWMFWKRIKIILMMVPTYRYIHTFSPHLPSNSKVIHQQHSINGH